MADEIRHHPKKNEEEFFLKREAENLAARRAGADAARDAEERRTHAMRCPKCGGHLAPEQYHAVTVDRCPDCKGIWFDAGEAEGLLDHEPGALTRLFGDLVRGVAGGRPKKA
jgi:hypothetical protein